MKQITYTFEPMAGCDMCGAGADKFKVLGKRLNGSQGFNPRKKMGITTTIVRCGNCGLVFSNPLPLPKSLLDHYGIPPEDYWVPSYFEVKDGLYSGLIELVQKHMPFTPGQKVLDIGAGLGKCMISFDRAGYETYGIEPTEPFYERAINRMGVSPDKLKMKTIEEAEFPENEFDFITYGAVLEHLYYPSNNILKAMKWLKPGGVMYIEVPSSDWLIARMVNFAYKVRGMDYVANLSPMHEPFHLYEFTLKAFQEHAKKNGYAIPYSEYYVCKTYMPKLIDPLLKWYMAKTNTGMQLAVLLRK